MKSRLIPALILLCVIPNAYALEVQTDKTDYFWNDKITITGITTANDTHTADFWILHKNIWYEHQTLEAVNGTFSINIPLSDTWAGDGTYTARLDYQGETVKIPFTVSQSNSEIVEPISESVEASSISPEPIVSPITEPTKEPIIETPVTNSTVETVPNNTSTNQTSIDVIQTPTIPSWVKGVFVFWSNGQISDEELLQAIRFLVNNHVLVL